MFEALEQRQLLAAYPTDLLAAATSASQINLTWTDNTTLEDFFTVERSPDGTTGWAEIDTAARNATSYLNVGLSASTTYHYRVTAKQNDFTVPVEGDGFGGIPIGDPSNVANATTQIPPPAAPSGLTATAASSSQINLAWTDNATNETGFRVERSPNGSSGWTQIGTAAQNATTYADTTVADGARYYYRVFAYHSVSSSAASATANALTPMRAPSGLAGVSVSAIQLNLSWTDNSATETTYYIEQSLNGSTGWSQVGTVGTNITTFSAPGPFNPSTTYYFRVRGYNATAGYSAYSANASTTTGAFPLAPTGLSAVAASASQINLSWTDTSNETGYKVERSLNGSSGWAQIGTTAQNVTTYSDAGLPEATRYYYRLRANNADGDSRYSSTVNTLTWPATPTNATATFVSSTRIDVTWTDNSSKETNYYVEQSTTGTGGWSQVGSVGANVTTFSAPGPFNPSTTYYFRVRAYAGAYSAYSGTASASTNAFPNTPSGLTLSAVSDTQINLQWTDNSGDEAGFKIERSANGTTSWTQVASVGAGVNTYSNSGLPSEAVTNYYYRVRAYNANGDSPYSNAPSVYTLHRAPTNLVATPISSTRTDLSWTDNSGREANYYVEQSATGTSGWSQVGSVGANVTTFSAPGPFSPSTTYYFRVRARSTYAYSAYSGTATATTADFPTAPTGLAAAAVSDTQIALSWADNSNESGYKVERSLNGSSAWTQVGTTGANQTTFTDGGLTEAKRYYYRIRAYNAAGDSVYSATANTYTYPAAASGASATFVSATQITVTWSDNSVGESGFRIEQSPDGSSAWSQIGTTGANVTTFHAPGPFNGSTTYYFRVRAYNTSGNATPSNITSSTTAAYPNTPSGLTASAVSSSEINLSWTDNSTNETGFTIERSPNNATWTQIGTVGANVTGFGDTGLTQNTTYYYRVKATNAAGGSSYATAPGATTNYNTPTVATPAAANPSTVTDKTTNLSVLGALPGGSESSLKYTWAVTSAPSGGSASFSANGTNAAKNTTTTFTVAAGNYTFTVTIANGTATTTSSTTVTVQQTLTSITVTPTSAIVPNDGTKQFTAVAKDQFGKDMATQPTFTWSVDDATLGSISSSGLFTASSDKIGTTIIRAAAGGKEATATLEVGDKVLINFDNLPAWTAVTDQYQDVGATFSGDPGVPNRIVPSTDASQPNSLGAGTESPTNPGMYVNPYDKSTYVDFALPVNALRFYQMRNDVNGHIASVKVFEKGVYKATEPITGVDGVRIPELVDLSAYRDVTRIEIVNITDPAGLLWDDFSFRAGKVDLEIFKPAVVDPAESMISEADEVSKGSVTFVNLDNDDNDAKFDDTDDAVAGGDDELVKVRMKLPKHITDGTVKLTATAGAGDIKVWKQKDKAAASVYNLGDVLTVPGDFTVDGDWLVKELWVEGKTAQTTQQATKLRAEYEKGTFRSADTASLTVVGVEKVEWVGYDNAHDDSNNLDADPNWPAGLTPSALRVFPDKRVFQAGANWVQDPDPRSIMRIKTTLSVAPPLDVKVYLRAFDADDPSADSNVVDNESGATDNRGASGTFGWQASGVTPNADVTKELSFAAGDTMKQADYIVSMQPGDNYRLVANADKDFLLRLNNNDDELNVGGAAADAHKQRIVNQDIPVATNPADREVRQAAKYCSDVLTVWRFLHVERDSMAALSAGMNEVTGTVNDIVGTGKKLTEVKSVTSFADGSRDLDSSPADNGRFEKGTLVVGADTTKMTISPIDGNGTNRLVFPETSIAGLSFTAEDTDYWTPTDRNKGTITELTKSGTSFVWTLNVTTEEDADWSEFVGGKLFVSGGGAMTITAANRAAGTMTTSSMNIPFTVKDDDTVSSVSTPDTTTLTSTLAPAYVLPVLDGGGNPAFDRADVAPSANLAAFSHAAMDAEFNKTGAFESKGWRNRDYWVAYALNAYQPHTQEDGDSDSESRVMGLTHSIASATSGSIMFEETITDYVRANGLSAADHTEIRRRVTTHEIAHQFFIPDQDNPPGSSNNLFWYADVFNLSGSVNLIPKHLDKVRSVTSPGSAL